MTERLALRRVRLPIGAPAERFARRSYANRYAARRQDHMPQIEVRGVELEYRERGQGDPLFLVHGSQSDYRTWVGQLGRFASSFRTIAYSRRYHWPNASISDGVDYSMMEQVEDLGAVISSLGGGRAHVVGHSYGAYLALLLAIHRPELIRRMVLAEPPVLRLYVSVPPRLLELVRLLLTRPRTAAAIIQFGARGMGPATSAIRRGDREAGLRLSASAVLGKETFENLSAERLQQARDNLIDAELIGSGFAALTDADVSGVRHRTLLLGSSRSPPVFRSLLDRLQQLLPDAERANVPDASHIMHEDNPDAFFQTVNAFLCSPAA
jgi:pimeloyl-ACP methyl ester carboxylesterase